MNNPIIKLTNANAERIDEIEIENVSGFVNDLIDKFFSKRIIELNDENKLMIDKLAADAEKTNDQVVNRCLSSAVFSLTKEEKPIIEIDRPTINVKKKRQTGINPSVNW